MNNKLEQAIELVEGMSEKETGWGFIEEQTEAIRLVIEAAGRKNFDAVKMTDLCVKALYGEQGEGTLLSVAIKKLGIRELRCFVSFLCAMIWLELNPEIPRMPSDTALAPKWITPPKFKNETKDGYCADCGVIHNKKGEK